MTADDRYRRAKQIFLRAAELEGLERRAFLDESCGNDHALRAEIDRLLGAAEETSDASPLSDPPAISTYIGREIGGYKVIRLIEMGGMGAVFEAIQERPRRVVALKLMKHGSFSRSAERRFEDEAEILGRLRHPNIAQIFEAGTHDDGTGPLPYFAMEFIPGATTLTAYAVERTLGTRQRLELFRKVCDAVHHGHQRGIIHRDLKPSNILVDSRGEPKVIDFGIARLTDSDIAATTMRTDVGQLVGTLQYMSPEQCLASSHDLDTRSDVYSLGVVLYQLLCGRPPYDVTRASIIEATRIIRQEEPSRLSSVQRSLRGDVETITLKALAKNRDERYGSASELRDDIGRYLKSEPIIARPPTMTYHFRSFVRRHPVQVAAAGVIMLVLVAATIVSLIFAQSEYRQRRQAQLAFNDLESVVQFQEDMLLELRPEEIGVMIMEDIADRLREKQNRQGPLDHVGGPRRPPRGPGGRPPDPSEMFEGIDKTGIARRILGQMLLERADATLDAATDVRPYAEGKLRLGFGRIYLVLGWYPYAHEQLTEAYSLLRAQKEATRRDIVVAAVVLGDVETKLGRYKAAKKHFAEGLASTSPELTPDLFAEGLLGLGTCHREEGDLDKAERSIVQAMDICEAALDDGDETSMRASAAYFWVCVDAERYLEAERIGQSLLEQRESARGREDPATIDAICDLGVLYSRWGKLSEAEALLEEAMKLDRRVRGAVHEHTFYSTASYAELLVKIDRANDAIVLMNLIVMQALRRPVHWSLARYLSLQGDCHVALGRPEKAEECYSQSYDVYVETIGARHYRAIAAAEVMRAMCESQGRTSEVVEVWRSRTTEPFGEDG